ncbi:MAG: glycosyltransferase [Acidobacteriota bacterium]
MVHFHASAMVVAALDALRRDAAGMAAVLDVVVVDNGGDAEDRERLRALAEVDDLRLVTAAGNLGYAGGANLGVGHLDQVEAFVLMNPDVLVMPGCLASLLRELEGGAAVAGPRFWWDRSSGFLLPPTDAVGRGAELTRVLARRFGGAWARRLRRDGRAHARRFWRAETAFDCFDLSGALLAIGTEAWRQVGPFDEGYRLYFEETDWLVRARRLGLRARAVPTARAEHLYAQSSPHEPRARAWMAESQERFRRRVYGGAFDRLVRTLDRDAKAPNGGSLHRPDDRWAADPSIRWLEISPSGLGWPAAGCEVDGLDGGELLVPPTLWSRLGRGSWWCTALDARGRTRQRLRVEKT